MNFPQSERRVVVTGIGIISPNGNDLDTFWQNVVGGISAGAPITHFDTSNIPVKIAAEVKDFSIRDYFPTIKTQRYDRCVQFSLASAFLALKDSGIDAETLDPDRSGVIEGTTISAMESILKAQSGYSEGSYKGIRPYNVVGGYFGEGSSTICLHLGIRGHAVTYCAGCSSGNDAIGYAMRMIQRDESDVMLAGGSEAIVELMHAGFCKLKTMSERNAEPKGAMRPFDRSRDGFLLGEGATFLVVEELMHALARGAKIYAEVAGHGRSCEAYHATDPSPDGRGYRGAISRSMRDAGLSASDVDYINAHASATQLNDPIETEAIKGVFGDQAKRVSVSATKPITGHLMGAAGAIEAAICVLALERQQIPPTINLRNPDPRCDLDYVSPTARNYPIRAALNVNAGFGGRYACLTLKKYPS